MPTDPTEQPIVTRAKRVLREGGPAEVVRRGVPFVYEEFVRPWLPKDKRVVTFNGVQAQTGDVCAADRFVPWFEVPWYHSDVADYEEPLMTALRGTVSVGDDVVIVGGGWGVTAVVAAQLVGETGHVTVFEGSEQRVKDLYGTLDLNGVVDHVTVHHAIVGDPVALAGAPSGAERVSPGDLPECDVLEMDCEGSEVDVLSRLVSSPRAIVVETHRNEDEVRSELGQLGYRVVARDVEKPGEIFILTAEVD